MITIPDAMRRPAEVEREELQKQLSEARAEIAKLRKLLATRIEATRLDEAVDQLADARADAEHWKSECNALQRMVHEARAEIDRLQGKENEADALLRKCLHLLEEQVERGGV